MDTSIFKYTPFQHDNLSYIKNVLDIARVQKYETLDGALTATLIYMNAVDYISSHLLENLIKIDSLLTNHHMNGIVFRNDQKLSHLPLKKVIDELNRYEFPMKTEFIEDLNKFKDMRNPIAHNLLSLRQEQITNGSADAMLFGIRDVAERLMDKYDTIVRGVWDEWYSYLYRISNQTAKTATGGVEENETTSENTDVKVVDASTENPI